MIAAILATDSMGGIALNGVLPWEKNKSDMLHFVRMTKNKTVVMGRATWEAPDMPSPLPNRKNVVVTRDPTFHDEGVDMVISSNISDALYELSLTEEVMIIGGAKLIELTMDDIDVFYLTEMIGDYGCDVKINLREILDNYELADERKTDSTIFRTYTRTPY